MCISVSVYVLACVSMRACSRTCVSMRVCVCVCVCKSFNGLTLLLLSSTGGRDRPPLTHLQRTQIGNGLAIGWDTGQSGTVASSGVPGKKEEKKEHGHLRWTNPVLLPSRFSIEIASGVTHLSPIINQKKQQVPGYSAMNRVLFKLRYP